MQYPHLLHHCELLLVQSLRSRASTHICVKYTELTKVHKLMIRCYSSSSYPVSMLHDAAALLPQMTKKLFEDIPAHVAQAVDERRAVGHQVHVVAGQRQLILHRGAPLDAHACGGVLAVGQAWGHTIGE